MRIYIPGFIAKDFLNPLPLLSVLPGAEKRIDFMDDNRPPQHKEHMNRRHEEQAVSGFDYSALPPVSTFEYHPANYDMMQQKLNLIKVQELLSIQSKTNPISHQHNIYNNNNNNIYNNIEKFNKGPMILRNDNTENSVDYSASYDFKPFFPDYNRHKAQITGENVVVNQNLLNNQRQWEEEDSYDSKNSALLKLLNLPSNVKDFDKFLDTKTVVAGVDTVEN